MPKLPLSRRHFLKTAAAGLATAPIASRGARAQVRVPEPPGRKLGWAVVGLGSLAINQILPAFAKCEKSKVVAFVSGHRDKADKLAARYGVEAANIYNYENYDSIKDNPAIDVVYVVLPNSMHAEYTGTSVEDGQARPLREADGEHAGRVRADDCCGDGGVAQADDRVPPPLRAVQQRADQGRARSGVRADARDSGGGRLPDRRPDAVAAEQEDGGWRLDDGHRNLRAERLALFDRRRTRRAERDAGHHAERSALPRGRREHPVPAAVPERRDRQLHVQLRCALQSLPRGRHQRLGGARAGAELQRSTHARERGRQRSKSGSPR